MSDISIDFSLASPARFAIHDSRLTIHACLLLLLLFCGCSREKSTNELLQDLKSQQDRDKITAVRLLPGHEGDAAKIIPALIESLKDKDGDVRRSAALGLGNFGDKAKEAIPALQALQKDHDVRVRESAALALSRIDPSKFTVPSKGHSKSK
jgi:vesicle coat complex subunit